VTVDVITTLIVFIFMTSFRVTWVCGTELLDYEGKFSGQQKNGDEN